MVHGNTNSEARNPKQIRILKYSNIKAGPQSRDRPFWVGQVLLLRREWLADKVGVDKDDEMPEWPEGKKLLNLGVMLFGHLCFGAWDTRILEVFTEPIGPTFVEGAPRI